MSTAEIDDIVYTFTKEHGGIPAPLNYQGFPKSVCTSLNNEICHGIPDKNITLQDGDIIQSRFAVERRNRTIHSRMREYLYELKHTEELETSVIPIGDGVTVSTKVR